MNYQLTKYFLWIALTFLYSGTYATHILGGRIIVQPVDNSLTYKITVIGYRDTNSNIEFGKGILSVGDRTEYGLSEFSNIWESPLENDISLVSFTVIHTYMSSGEYTLSYQEDFRSADIVNLDKAVESTFYVEAKLTIDPLVGSFDPGQPWKHIDVKAYRGQAFMTNLFQSSGDMDRVRYSIHAPKRAGGHNVSAYKLPDNEMFYSVEPLNESGTGPAQFTINALNGNLRWDAPGDMVNPYGSENSTSYTVTVLLKMQKEILGVYRTMATSLVEFNIHVSPEIVDYPDVIIPDQVCSSDGKIEFDLEIDADEDVEYQLEPHFDHDFLIDGAPILNLKNEFYSGSSSFHFSIDSYEVVEGVVHRGAFVLRPVGLATQSFGLAYTTNCGELPDLVAGVEEPAEIDFLVYPNPGHGTFFVKSNSNFSHLKIVNLLGQVMHEQEVHNSRISCNLQEGVYFVQFHSADGQLMGREKLIIRQ